MIKPKPLAMGATIGVAAPASCFEPGRFERGLQALSSLGCEVLVPVETHARNGYLAGEDRPRALAFTDLWHTQGVDAVLCARGGYGSMRLLEHLDFAALSADPKPLVGFSDITALLVTLVRRAGLVVFHGPVLTSLGAGMVQDRVALWDALTFSGTQSIRIPRPVVVRPGRAAGTVLGGNLTTLCHMAGTPFQPDFSGCLLFLEDRGEAPYRLDRMLWQMNASGMLDGVRGVILGSFADCGPLDVVCSLVAEALPDRAAPVVAGFPAGHGPENLTFAMGVEATLDTDTGMLEYHEPALEER
ncbi:MAG: LD-carboxypeptidase [Desulfatibacillaceae bacterium]